MSRSLWKYCFTNNKNNNTIVYKNDYLLNKQLVGKEKNKQIDPILNHLENVNTNDTKKTFGRKPVTNQRSNKTESVYTQKPISGPEKESEMKVWSRNCTVMPEDIGKRFKIYNGKDWIIRKVVENMVNHKFGEFALTKKKSIHKLNKKKQNTRK